MFKIYNQKSSLSPSFSEKYKTLISLIYFDKNFNINLVKYSDINQLSIANKISKIKHQIFTICRYFISFFFFFELLFEALQTYGNCSCEINFLVAFSDCAEDAPTKTYELIMQSETTRA